MLPIGPFRNKAERGIGNEILKEYNPEAREIKRKARIQDTNVTPANNILFKNYLTRNFFRLSFKFSFEITYSYKYRRYHD